MSNEDIERIVCVLLGSVTTLTVLLYAFPRTAISYYVGIVGLCLCGLVLVCLWKLRSTSVEDTHEDGV